MPGKTRSYVFTLNNYTSEEEEAIKATECSYLVYGREIGAGGTPHLQGYIEFKNARALGGVALLAGFTRCHLERRRGSQSQASDYCKKDGDFFEKGSFSRSGCRTDLNEIKDKIENGVGLEVIASEHFKKWVVYRRSFEAYSQLQSGPRDFKSLVIVLWGPTGVGKSRFVHDSTSGGALWIHGGDRWFDGYTGQEYALFDDFDGSQLEFRMLLRILDRYPVSVPVKGGFANWRPRKIFITSNVSPKGWYLDVDSSPLQRRIDVEHYIPEDLYP